MSNRTSGLFLAAQHNDVRALRRLILDDTGNALNATRNSKGKTMLMVAAEADAVGTVVLLLLMGADWNAVDRDAQTAQSNATACGCVSTPKILEAWRRQAERDDLEYRSIVPELVNANRQKLVDKLCERAVEGDARAIVGLFPRLVANGGLDMYINAPDKYSVTALYAASRGNHVDAIHALVGAGCELDAVETEYGWSALMCAAANGAVEALEVLANHGADVWLADRYDNTALDIAREGKQQQAAKMLRHLRNKNG